MVSSLIEKDNLLDYTNGLNGVLIKWETHLITAQIVTIVVLSVWSTLSTLLILLAIKYSYGLRMSVQEEILGPDFIDHGLIHDGNADILKIISRKIDINKF